MKIRPYSATDSDELLRLFFETIRTVNVRDYSEEQVRAWAPEKRDPEQWRRSFEGREVLVAEAPEKAQEKILGFAELEPNGHIDRFYVHKDHISQGVGKALYAKLEAKARELNLTRLFVEASITARPFFEARGFALVREQSVRARGVALTNFAMEKRLSARASKP